jgi:hypothetical protein
MSDLVVSGQVSGADCQWTKALLALLITGQRTFVNGRVLIVVSAI